MTPEIGSTPRGDVGAPLLEAIVSLSTDLDTQSLLDRIVVASCTLTGARYGALAVLDHDQRVVDLHVHGLSVAEAEQTGRAPRLTEILAPAAHSGALRLAGLDELSLAVGSPDQHPQLTSLLTVHIRVRGTGFGTIYLGNKPGPEGFTQHDEDQVRALATVAGFVIENALAYAVGERRRRWLEMIGELTELIQPPVSLDEALERITVAVHGASEALWASIVQVPDSGELFIAATAGETELMSSDERVALEAAVRSAAATGEIEQVVLEGDRTALLAPLRAHLTAPGVLALVHSRDSRPDYVEERELLSSFGDQVALSLDRTQALEDREEMAVVADRDRIARDLHDVVIQRLFATALQLQSLRSAADNPALKERIELVVKDMDQTIRDIRSTIFELQNRPQNSLRSEVRDLVREYVPILGFAPSVQLQGRVDFPIDARVQQLLVATAREALSNVAQHARAGMASVELRVSETQLQLKVSDNGRGLPGDRTGQGIRNSRRRAAMLGGTLDLWPNEPSGTLFVWSVPLEQGS